MKTETLLDIIFCILVMPGMMFLFPTGEWIQWHPTYVLGYILWLYGVWFLCRKLLGPAARQGRRGIVTAVGTLFLLGIVTFLMSLTSVDFPRDTSQLGRLQPHICAMWVLLLAVISYAMPMGILSSRIGELKSEQEQSNALANARTALETRRLEAETAGGEDIQVKADYKTVHIPLSAIQFIEGRNNYACFHLDHREDVVSQISLKNVLELLPEGKFVRIHRSFIVPVWRIEKRTGTEVRLMGIDSPLPVGRAFKEDLKNLQ